MFGGRLDGETGASELALCNRARSLNPEAAFRTKFVAQGCDFGVETGHWLSRLPQ